MPHLHQTKWAECVHVQEIIQRQAKQWKHKTYVMSPIEAVQNGYTMPVVWSACDQSAYHSCSGSPSCSAFSTTYSSLHNMKINKQTCYFAASRYLSMLRMILTATIRPDLMSLAISTLPKVPEPTNCSSSSVIIQNIYNKYICWIWSHWWSIHSVLRCHHVKYIHIPSASSHNGTSLHVSVRSNTFGSSSA